MVDLGLGTCLVDPVRHIEFGFRVQVFQALWGFRSLESMEALGRTDEDALLNPTLWPILPLLVGLGVPPSGVAYQKKTKGVWGGWDPFFY